MDRHATRRGSRALAGVWLRRHLGLNGSGALPPTSSPSASHRKNTQHQLRGPIGLRFFEHLLLLSRGTRKTFWTWRARTRSLGCLPTVPCRPLLGTPKSHRRAPSGGLLPRAGEGEWRRWAIPLAGDRHRAYRNRPASGNRPFQRHPQSAMLGYFGTGKPLRHMSGRMVARAKPKSRHLTRLSPLLRYGGTTHGLDERNADRAVP